MSKVTDFLRWDAPSAQKWLSLPSHHNPSICPFARSTGPEIRISRTSSQVVDPVGTRKSRPSTNLENAKSTSRVLYAIRYYFLEKPFSPLTPSLTYHWSFPVQVHAKTNTPNQTTWIRTHFSPPSGDYIDLPIGGKSSPRIPEPLHGIPLDMSPPVLSVARFLIRVFWYKLPEGFLKKKSQQNRLSIEKTAQVGSYRTCHHENSWMLSTWAGFWWYCRLNWQFPVGMVVWIKIIIQMFHAGKVYNPGMRHQMFNYTFQTTIVEPKQ